MIETPWYLLIGAAALVVAVCIAATRYATLRGMRVADMLEEVRELGYRAGADELYDDARRYVQSELGASRELAPLPEYEVRAPAPDQWLHDALTELGDWSARQQAKQQRWYWRTLSATISPDNMADEAIRAHYQPALELGSLT